MRDTPLKLGKQKMNSIFLYHRDENYGESASFKERRLAFRNTKASPSPESFPTPKNLETAHSNEVKKLDRELERRKKDVVLFAKEYNDYWGRGDQDNPLEKKVVIDFKNIKGTIADLKLIEKALNDQLLLNGLTDKVRTNFEKQKKYILFLQDSIEYAQDGLRDKKEGAKNLILARRTRLKQEYERYTRGKETLKSWKDSPLFDKTTERFEGLIDSPEFKQLWETQYGLETGMQTESRQLFMALMAQETAAFSKPSYFGPGFDNVDYKSNIEKFPYLYREWMKEEVGQDAFNEIEAAGAKVDVASSLAASTRPIEVIVREGVAAGLDQAELDQLRTEPKDEAWKDRSDVIYKFMQRLKSSANTAKSNEDESRAKDYNKLADELSQHKKLADAQYSYYRIQKNHNKISEKFTAAHFSQTANHQQAIKLAMLKFQKAVEMVDHPYGEAGDSQRHLNPTVRRQLISTFYREGVAKNKLDENGNVEYQDNIGKDKAKLIAALLRSPHFNASKQGEHLDSRRREALKLISIAFEVIDFHENVDPVDKLIDRVLELHVAYDGLDEATTDLEKKKAQKKIDGIRRKLSAYPAVQVEKFINMDLDELHATKRQIGKDKSALAKHLKIADALIDNPYSTKSRKLIKEFKEKDQAVLQSSIEGLADIMVIDEPNLARYTASMQTIELDFNALDLVDKNEMKIFEKLGIHAEGMYKLYKTAIQKPKYKGLTFDKWNSILTGDNKAKFNLLVEFLGKIIPEGHGEGKTNFLTSFKSLYGKENLAAYLTDPKMDGDHGVSIGVYQMIKTHLYHSGQAESFAGSKAKETAAKHDGWDVGSLISHGVGGAWGMLTGPGELSTKLAGGVLIYTLIKTARKAMKGEGKSGKLLRMAFLGGALEIFMKQTTGRGLLDRAGLDLLEGAMEGTYEKVLSSKAQAFFNNEKYKGASEAVTQDEHERALVSMKNIPFHELMDWYGETDAGGAYVGKGGTGKSSKAKYKLPSKLKASKIVPGGNPNLVNKNQRASYVLRKTMEHFFFYVGNKDNKRGMEHGRQAVEERWVTMITDPGHNPKFTDTWHKGFSEEFRGNQDALTWQFVMRAEIDPTEIDLTKKQTLVGKAETLATEAFEGVSAWSDKYLGKISGHSEDFLDSFGESAGEASDTIKGLIDEGATDLYFTKERLKLTYKTHKIEMKRIAGEHWEILATGVKLPFKVILGVDRFVMPAVLSKLKALETIVKTSVTSEISGDLTMEDIIGLPGSDPTSPNLDINPKYAHFGIFQSAFAEAFNDQDQVYIESVDQLDPNTKKKAGVGYFISSISIEDAGIDITKPEFKNQPQAVENALMIASQKKAIDEFTKHSSLDKKMVEKHMYAIHTTKRTTPPQTMHVFWRMAMPGSVEYYLKETGRWHDFVDPNRFKDRGPLILDASNGKWNNLVETLKLDTGPVQRVLSGAGKYAIQVPRFGFGAIETLGAPVKAIAQWAMADNQQEREAIGAAMDTVLVRPESQRQWIDEYFSSASSTNTALSEFYKDPINAKLYDFSIQYARANTLGSPYLGLLEDREVQRGGETHTYEGGLYTYPPRGLTPTQTYQSMLQYYQQEWSKSKGKGPDQDILDAINEAITKAGNPATP